MPTLWTGSPSWCQSPASSINHRLCCSRVRWVEGRPSSSFPRVFMKIYANVGWWKCDLESLSLACSCGATVLLSCSSSLCPSVCLSVVQPPPPPRPPRPITAAATILNYCRARLRLNHRQPELINSHSLSFSDVCVHLYSLLCWLVIILWIFFAG